MLWQIKRGEERGEGKKLEGLENASGGVQARLKEVSQDTRFLTFFLDGRLLTSFLNAGSRTRRGGALGSWRP